MIFKFTAFIKKYRHPLCLMALALSTLFVFKLLYTFTDLHEGTAKAKSVLVNDAYTAYSSEISTGEIVTQSFVFNDTLHRIGIIPDLKNCTGEGYITLEVKSAESGQLLRSCQKELSSLVADSYNIFVFDEPIVSKGILENYTLDLSFTSSNKTDTLSFAKSEEAAQDNWLLTSNGKIEDGGLTFMLTIEIIGSYFTSFYFAFAIICAVSLCLLYLIIFCFKAKIHTITFGAILILGCLYGIVFPPYTAPDEAFHINQSFNNSSIALNQIERKDIAWGTNYKRPSDTNEVIEDQLPSIFMYREFSENLLTLSPDKATDTKVFDKEEVGGYNVPYFASSLAILLCRFLHLGFVPTLLLGRLANLLMCATLVFFAVKFMPYGKAAMAICSVLPMSLHLFMSYSRDGFIISMAFLLTALCFYAIESKDPLPFKTLILLAFVSIIFAPAKATYVPLCLMVVLIPIAAFKNKKVAVGTIISTLAFTLANYTYNNRILLRTLVPQLPEAVSVQAVQEVTQTVTYVNPDYITFNTGYILSHIFQTISLITNSIVKLGDHYLKTLIGGKLSYFSVEISWVWVIGFIILLFMASHRTQEEVFTIKPFQFTFIQLLALACAALVVGGCILWTPTYWDTIYGIQGRYFLPMLPIFLLLLKGKTFMIKKDISLSLMFAAGVLNIFVLINSLLVIL